MVIAGDIGETVKFWKNRLEQCIRGGTVFDFYMLQE